MLRLLAKIARTLTRTQRPSRQPRKRRSAVRHSPTLQVRTLEERRVFHAGALAPTAPTSQTVEPPPTTTITLDAEQNLLVQDAAAGGQNDQLTIRLNVENGCYEIYDPSNLLSTDIVGASGSGTNTIYVPVALVTGDRLIVSTGAGDDSLTVDLSGGLGGKTLVFDGGDGHDTLALLGGTFDVVAYLFSGAGTTQIDLGLAGSEGRIELDGVEPIFDDLATGTREFTLGVQLAGLTLSDDALAANGRSLLTTAWGTSVTFLDPWHGLSLGVLEDGSGATLALTGLDAQFAGNVQIDAGSGHVEIAGHVNLHGGSLSARGETILLDGTVVTREAAVELRANSSLTVTAEGVIENAGGRVVLDAGEGTLRFAGRIDAAGRSEGEVGGTVHLLARQVELLGQASVDATGHSGGGTVLVGGDYQGLNPAVRNATNTLVEAGVAIDASALVQGDGGTIIVWADEVAIVAGSGNLRARGGAQSGDGGLIETSGKRYLYVLGAPDAGADAGAAGLWLLDPFNVTIVATSSTTLTDGVLDPTADDTQIAASTIEAALVTTNVTINTGSSGTQDGNITVKAAIDASLTGTNVRTLTFNAANDIIIEQSITKSGSANSVLHVVLNANTAAGGGDPDPASGDVLIGAAIAINGNFTSTGVGFDNTGGTITAGGAILLTHTGDVLVAAAASGANFTSSGAAFQSTSTITTAGGAVAIHHTGDVSIGGAVLTNNGNFSSSGAAFNNSGGTITAGSGAVTLSHSGNVTVAAAISGQSFTSTGQAAFASSDKITTAGGTATIDHEGNVTIGGAVETGGGGFASDGQDFTSTATITTAGGAVTIDHEGDVQIGGAVATSGGSFTSGGAAFANTGSISTGAGTITITHTGDVLIGANVTGTGAADVTSTAADVEFGAGTLSANTVTVTAAGTIASATAATDVAASGMGASIALHAQSLGAAGAPLRISLGGGSLSLTAEAGDVYVLVPTGNLNTSSLTLDVAGEGRIVSIATASGSITFGGITSVDDNTADDHFIITAGGAGSDIRFTGGATLVAASATLTAADEISTDSTTSPIIDTSAADGDITLSAATLGTAANPLRIEPGEGHVSLSATGGPMFVAWQSGDLVFSRVSVSSSQIGATIGLQADSGRVLLDDLSGLDGNTKDDHFELRAGGGDLQFLGNTTLVGASVLLEATGDILGSSGVTNVDTSATVGKIALSGQSIGTAATPFRFNSGTGTLSFTATAGDLYVALADGELRTSRITTLSAAGVGVQISLQALNGPVVIDSVAGFDANTNNDHFTLYSQGATAGISFSGTPRLIAASARLETTGAIAGGSSTIADIDTSAAGGNIVLIAGLGIGTAVNPLLVRTGSGEVSGQTTGASGNIYLASNRTLRLGSIATAAGGIQDVQVSTIDDGAGGVSRNIEILSPISGDDRWTLDSAADIVLVGNASLAAWQFKLIQAAGAVVSGTAAVDFDSSQSGQTIVIDAGSIGAADNPVILDPGAGLLDLTARTGDLAIALKSGDLTDARFAGSRILVSDSGVTIALVALDGNIILTDLFRAGPDEFSLQPLGTLSDNHLWLEARGTGGNIILERDSLQFASVTLLADGSILTFSGFLGIDTSHADGNITLESFGAIGSPFAPVVVNAGTGVVSVKTTGPGGHIFLKSDTLLNLGTIATDPATIQIVSLTTTSSIELTAPLALSDILILHALGDITFSGQASITAHSVHLIADGGTIFSGDAAVDVDTRDGGGFIALEAAGIGTSGSPLVIAPGGSIEVLATSEGLYLDVVTSGDLAVSRFSRFEVHGAGQEIHLHVAGGSLLIDRLLDPLFSSTHDDLLHLSATGNIEFRNSALLIGQSIVLDAGGQIVGGTGPVDVFSNSTLDLRAPLGIGVVSPLRIVAGGVVTASTDTGDIVLRTPTDLLLGQVSTGAGMQTVDIRADGPSGSLFITAPSDTDDHWNLFARDSILFVGPGSVAAAQFTATAEMGAILSGDAAADIDTSAADGAISLTARAIGMPGDPLVLKPGAGELSLTATGGGIWVDVAGGNLHASQIAGLSVGLAGMQIALTTTDGSIILDGNLAGFQPNTQDDTWILTAVGGNIEFDNSQPLIAATFTIVADGVILSGSGAIDLMTTSGGAIDLTAAGGIGAAVNPLALSAGAGLVSATTSQAGGDIFVHSVGVLNLGSVATAAGSTQEVAFSSTGNLNLRSAIASNDDWSLSAGGDVRVADFALLRGNNILVAATGGVLGGDLDPDAPHFAINGPAGEIDLTGAELGQAGQPLRLELAGGDLRLSTSAAGSGGMYAAVLDGALHTSQIKTLSAAASGATISLETRSGSIILDATSQFSANTQNDHFVLFAGGVGSDLVFQGVTTLTAANATLSAFGSIVSGGAALDVQLPATGSLLQLYAFTGAIGESGNPLSFRAGELIAESFGPQYLSTDGTTRLLFASTFGSDIALESGSFLLAGDVFHPFFYFFGFPQKLVVANDTVLGGQGEVWGSLLVQDSAIVDPGFQQLQTGKLFVAGNATFMGGTTLLLDINAPYLTAGSDYDQLVVGGTVTLLDGPILELRGGESLQVTIGNITLIDNQGPNRVQGTFAVGEGSVVLDPRTGLTRVSVGQFRGQLLYTGGDGNDVVLFEISLVPPIQSGNVSLPALDLPVFTRAEAPPPAAAAPPPAAPASEPPAAEVQSDVVAVRVLEVRIVVPIDDEGNVEERTVMTLPADWLTDLTGILWRLPDDRYRIYLILEGGEERRVLDVFVRNGRPFEPSEAPAPLPAPVEALPAEHDHHGEDRGPAEPLPEAAPPPSLPDLDDRPPPLLNDPRQGGALPAGGGLARDSGRLFVGAGAAVAAVLASRRPASRWAEQVDQAADEIGKQPQPAGWRWWRRPAARPATKAPLN